MKKIILLVLLSACTLISCNDSVAQPSGERISGQIYLYGEQHGEEKIMNKEFELWREYYTNENMRHLFIELPYYTAEFLNLWMQSDSDTILEEVYNDLAGTAMGVPHTKEFYKMFKKDCPKTIFHGTDVGHQYNSTGERYLKYLEANNLKDSGQYLLAKETIEQGKQYYGQKGSIYRENKLAENFIREFDKLNNQSVMGIYGGTHTGLDMMDATRSVPSMANQLKKRYGDAVHSANLHWVLKLVGVDRISVNGKEYEALYFGGQDLTPFNLDYTSRKFWRLENAYDDFRDKPKLNDNLPSNNYPSNNYPMLIEIGDYGTVQK